MPNIGPLPLCITKLGGFYDSDNDVLMEVTDPKLHFQYNVFVAISYSPVA